MPSRILLVDDEEIVLNGWVKALRPTGHLVLRARNRDEAVHAAESGPIDLAIIDYLVGRNTGIEILNLIRKKRPMVRSILISAQIEPHVTESEIKALIRDKVEFDSYLRKPVRNTELRQAVAILLENIDPHWQEWAQKAKAARESKPEDVAEADALLRAHIKKKE